jgi:hypothetical protein
MKDLDIRQVHDIPLSEVSGLGRRSPPGTHALQVIAVGDADYTLVVGGIKKSDEVSDFSEVKLQRVIGTDDPEQSSEWEAADGDVTGRVFILEENPSRVHVLSPELDELLSTIDLPFKPPDELAGQWDTAPNSQAEGLVLLRNGHVLVAKEKDPAVLLEFGPRTGDPEGVSPGLLFGSSDEFPAPRDQQVRFDLLEVWTLDSKAGAEIRDISDVAVGPDDRLYLLSDESRCIARVEPDLQPAEKKLSITRLWRLPPELEQPEGLVIDDDMGAIVAIDRAERAENLFVLSPLSD